MLVYVVYLLAHLGKKISTDFVLSAPDARIPPFVLARPGGRRGLFLVRSEDSLFYRKRPNGFKNWHSQLLSPHYRMQR